MKNTIPTSHPKLLILADKAAHGAFLFGAAIPLLQNTSSRPPGGQFDPRQGTQVVTGAGWYKIAVPGITEPAYISRDLVVVQQ